jgi:hypothetical protein
MQELDLLNAELEALTLEYERIRADAEGKKIQINGSFGKFGSPYSRLYGPDLLIQTTLTGQLSLLMAIEMLEQRGIPVVSANTDGVVVKCPTDQIDGMKDVFAEWEERTGFKTEETVYRQLHSRDVNNYIALKDEGGVKLKGAYAPCDMARNPTALMKNPVNEVCVQAVIDFLKSYTPVEETIEQCRDIRKFITIRQVKGGAVDQDKGYLGKAVRWYYADGVAGPLTYKLNGYTVARSEGARALMELPDEFPSDVNYDWYVREANSILSDIGVMPNMYLTRGLI